MQIYDLIDYLKFLDLILKNHNPFITSLTKIFFVVLLLRVELSTIVISTTVVVLYSA